MDVVFENISSLLIFTILFLVLYAALLNIYFIYKNGFHVSVNCWFCNKNSKVLYSNRNNFECPFCFQYNGFNKDGDYNKIIEPQHNASLNSQNIFSKRKTGHSTPKSSNGLCDSCNRNQELKILQLANYDPLEERNYDNEIVHFEKQLEKTYGLCKKCSKIVKNNIRKQNAWIFGTRIKNLNCSKSHKHLYDSTKAPQGNQKANKFYHRLSVTRLLLFTLSLFSISVLCGLHVYLPKNVLPESLLPNNVILSELYSSVYNFSVTNLGSKSFVGYLPKKIKLQESSILHICILGLLLELLLNSTEANCSLFAKFSKLFSWMILGLVSSLPFKRDVSLFFRALEIFCSLYLTYVYSSTCIEPHDKQRDKFRLKRIKRDRKYSDIDESDSDSLNNSRTSYRTAVNKHSPITANSFSNFNKSFESTRSTKSVHNPVAYNDLHSVKNLELNKHFNELNIGVFDSNKPRPVSPNPFLNQDTVPQSPSSLYSYNLPYNSNVFQNPSQNRPVFATQNPRLNSSFSNPGNLSYNFNAAPQLLNQTRRISPVCVNNEPMYNQDRSFNISNQGILNQPTTSFSLKNNYQHSNSFCPRDTSSVISQNITTPRSPGYNLRSNHRNVSSPTPSNQGTILNNSFRPLSPQVTLERPSRTFLSPTKFKNVNSFHSDGKENGILSMSLHADGLRNGGLWSNISGPHLPQRFVVNSLSNIVHNSPVNNSFAFGNVDVARSDNSRSSSTSSGFVSNGDYTKGISKSLPNSRENSPGRSSLLSEPVYA